MTKCHALQMMAPNGEIRLNFMEIESKQQIIKQQKEIEQELVSMPNPRHIAIIPDGNRRWAKAHRLPAIFGHRAGAQITEKILTAALTDHHVEYLTFWGASLSNITERDEKEVRFLFQLFTRYFKKIATSRLIHHHHVNIQVLGQWPKFFPLETRRGIEKAMAATKEYDDFHLTILLAYNGTEEMLSAIQQLTERARQEPTLVITKELLKKHLYTKDLPPVDLVIRTGSEPHLSNGFMMWETADAQLYFSKNLWPDFSPEELTKILANYSKTERRFGR